MFFLNFLFGYILHTSTLLAGEANCAYCQSSGTAAAAYTTLTTYDMWQEKMFKLFATFCINFFNDSNGRYIDCIEYHLPMIVRSYCETFGKALI